MSTIAWTSVEQIKQQFDEKERHSSWEKFLKNEEKLRERGEAIKEEERLKELVRIKGALPYSEPLAVEICERISSGELLIDICDDEHMPTVRRVTQWLRQDDDFGTLYKESINDRLTIFEEQIIKIADDASKDFRDVVRNGRSVRVLDGDAIARAKLRVEVRFRHLKAGRPEKWGEQSTLITKNVDECEGLTLEELDAKIAKMDHDSRAVRQVS
jgi:hypothetical protein